MRLESNAFPHHREIPEQFTEDGQDISPPLYWRDAPKQTREFALLVDDPDAPRDEPWVHWVVYHIPATASGLPENLPKTDVIRNPPGAIQGKTSWPDGRVGYSGPAPPPGHGVHHYHFHLYALDQPVPLITGADKDDLLAAIEGHVLAEAELVGTYQRKK